MLRFFILFDLKLMEIGDFLQLIRRKKQTIFSIVLVFLFFSLILNVIQPLKYESKSNLLVLQDLSSNFDPYSASKSNEYLSNILAKVTASEVFFGEVLNAGFNIDADYFSDSIDKKLKTWKQTVSAAAVNDTGIIAISIYHPDQYQAEQIARAVNYTLKTKNSQFHGGGDNVTVKIIDEPIVSKWPVKPNLPLNAVLALVLGFISALLYVYAFPDEKYNLRMLPGFKKKKAILYTQAEEKLSEPVFDRGDIRNVLD